MMHTQWHTNNGTHTMTQMSHTHARTHARAHTHTHTNNKTARRAHPEKEANQLPSGGLFDLLIARCRQPRGFRLTVRALPRANYVSYVVVMTMTKYMPPREIKYWEPAKVCHGIKLRLAANRARRLNH